MKKLSTRYKSFFLKGVCTALIIILGGSLFAAGALGADNCGMECCCKTGPAHMQPATEKQFRSQMGCCSGVPLSPCDLQSAKPFELPEFTMASCCWDFPNANEILYVADDSPNTIPNPGSNSISQILDPQFNQPPLYLQKLTFLI